MRQSIILSNQDNRHIFSRLSYIRSSDLKKIVKSEARAMADNDHLSNGSGSRGGDPMEATQYSPNYLAGNVRKEAKYISL